MWLEKTSDPDLWRLWRGSNDISLQNQFLTVCKPKVFKILLLYLERKKWTVDKIYFIYWETMEYSVRVQFDDLEQIFSSRRSPLYVQSNFVCLKNQEKEKVSVKEKDKSSFTFRLQDDFPFAILRMVKVVLKINYLPHCVIGKILQIF